ncbi:MAG: hypothetical protein ACLGJB_10630 [Blastocatellia bacterium]
MTRLGLFSSLLLLSLVFCSAAGALAQAMDRTNLEKEIQSLIDQLKAKEAQLFEPSADDRTAFAEFLRQPGAGLTRLMPGEKYDGRLLTRGAGAYYSFVRLTHEYGFGSDLSLEQNQFGVGFAGASFGFLTSLGDVPLASVSVDDRAVKFLSALAVPSKEEDAREQYRLGHSGFDSGGVRYANRLPAVANATYALRSVDYKRSDVLVAFRVVRQDSDGSMVLLWKILKRFPTPELAP